MADEKIYCSKCIFYSDSFIAGGDYCEHDSNVRTHDDYRMIHKIYIKSPEVLNNKNNCKNYMPKQSRSIDKNLEDDARLALKRFLGID